jgi:hypothetical protein
MDANMPPGTPELLGPSVVDSDDLVSHEHREATERMLLAGSWRTTPRRSSRERAHPNAESAPLGERHEGMEQNQSCDGGDDFDPSRRALHA